MQLRTSSWTARYSTGQRTSRPCLWCVFITITVINFLMQLRTSNWTARYSTGQRTSRPCLWCVFITITMINSFMQLRTSNWTARYSTGQRTSRLCLSSARTGSSQNESTLRTSCGEELRHMRTGWTTWWKMSSHTRRRGSVRRKTIKKNVSKISKITASFLWEIEKYTDLT